MVPAIRDNSEHMVAAIRIDTFGEGTRPHKNRWKLLSSKQAQSPISRSCKGLVWLNRYVLPWVQVPKQDDRRVLPWMKVPKRCRMV